MDELPENRVNPSQLFLHTGLEYCEPFQLAQCRPRNAGITKGYLAVFECFATKFIHLDLVSDLTTDAFLGALRRFVSRKGRCVRIQSDSGKNVRADTQLKEQCKFMNTEAHPIIEAACKEGILWRNPP